MAQLSSRLQSPKHGSWWGASTFMSRPCACFFCSGEKWLSDSDCAALLNSTCTAGDDVSATHVANAL